MPLAEYYCSGAAKADEAKRLADAKARGTLSTLEPDEHGFEGSESPRIQVAGRSFWSMRSVSPSSSSTGNPSWRSGADSAV